MKPCKPGVDPMARFSPCSNASQCYLQFISAQTIFNGRITVIHIVTVDQLCPSNLFEGNFQLALRSVADSVADERGVHADSTLNDCVPYFLSACV